MNYYAKNRKSRMEVKSHNEMGVLAENLNAMLDDIDCLTEENIRSKEQILEANYQKSSQSLLRIEIRSIRTSCIIHLSVFEGWLYCMKCLI